jgi:ATP-binding cassette, subfamily B, bacterial
MDFIKRHLTNIGSKETRTLLAHLQPFRKRAFVIVLLSILYELLCLVPPLITGYIIDQYLSTSDKVALPDVQKQIILLVSVLLVAYLMAEVLKIISSQLLIVINSKLAINFKEQLYTHILHLPLRKITHIKNGELISRISDDVEDMAYLANSLFLHPATALLRLIAILCYALYINAWLALLLTITLGGLSILCLHLNRKTRPIRRQIQEEHAANIGILSEVLQGIRVVRSFAKEKIEILQFSKRNESIASKELKANIQTQGINSLWSIIQGISTALILGVGSILIIQEKMTLGNLIIIQYYATLVINPIVSILSSVSSTQASLTALERYTEIMDLDRETLDSNETPPSIINSIKLKDLSFAYQDKPTLQNITCEFLRGQTIALVGSSGAGKSTLADIVCRFQEPDSGQLLINDMPASKLNLHEYRQNFGIVHQDNFVFDGTLRDNILYADSTLSDADIILACDKAQLNEFISLLPNGLDTIIGENGILLSGGQKQRLCLARAFACHKQILILDEATSHLDALNEQAIQHAIMDHKENMLTIVIAHNLDTIKNADLILVFKDGQLLEQGNHHELMDKQGEYANLRQS